MAACLIAMLPAPALAERCPIPKGWDEVAARGTRFVVFGELHGTRQGPEIIADLACALVKRREQILVALEQNATDDDALQALWAGDDLTFADAIPRALEWQGLDDGRASRAMLAMLVRLHTLKTRGAAIDVVAFNGARDDAQRERFKSLPGQGPYEAAQADNIRRAADAKRYDHVLVLVGNGHARKRSITQSGISYQPMAMRLAPPAAVTTLEMTYASGTEWSCIGRPGFTFVPGKPVPPDAIDCGEHKSRGIKDIKRRRFMALGRQPGSDADAAYDGYFWVGPVAASPPAVR